MKTFVHVPIINLTKELTVSNDQEMAQLSSSEFGFNKRHRFQTKQKRSNFFDLQIWTPKHETIITIPYVPYWNVRSYKITLAGGGGDRIR